MKSGPESAMLSRMGLGSRLAAVLGRIGKRTGSTGFVTETPIERFERRAVSGPALLFLTPAYAALYPWILAAAAAVDLRRGSRMTRARFATALGVNLGMHSAAFVGLFGSWLLGGQWRGAAATRERALDQELQRRWARWTWALSSRIYEMELRVEGLDCLRGGPVLILPRHTSLVDTLLPLVLSDRAAEGEALRLHYVMKHELLWDPVLDALGHRWPTAFVKRGTGDPEQIRHVKELGGVFRERDGIVLFPEGTRFSHEKREKILSSLRAKHPERLRVAEALEHLLPPHPAGVLALLDELPCDVVFLVHTGLEGANHFEDLLEGQLIGTRVQAELWRVPYASIPKGKEERIEWLESHWLRMEEWIRVRRDEPRSP